MDNKDKYVPIDLVNLWDWNQDNSEIVADLWHELNSKTHVAIGYDFVLGVTNVDRTGDHNKYTAEVQIRVKAGYLTTKIPLDDEETVAKVMMLRENIRVIWDALIDIKITDNKKFYELEIKFKPEGQKPEPQPSLMDGEKKEPESKLKTEAKEVMSKKDLDKKVEDLTPEEKKLAANAHIEYEVTKTFLDDGKEIDLEVGDIITRGELRYYKLNEEQIDKLIMDGFISLPKRN